MIRPWSFSYVGSILGFPGILARGESSGGALEKRPRRGPVESRAGVSGGKAQARISPGEGFDSFFEENIAILASSGMQEAASSDFQQMVQ